MLLPIVKCRKFPITSLFGQSFNLLLYYVWQFLFILWPQGWINTLSQTGAVFVQESISSGAISVNAHLSDAAADRLVAHHVTTTSTADTAADVTVASGRNVVVEVPRDVDRVFGPGNHLGRHSDLAASTHAAHMSQ